MKLGKTGRNDPCPCGSGKKFKKCCLGKQAIDLPFNLDDPFGDDPEYQKVCAEIDEAESEMFREMELSRKFSKDSFLKLLDRSPSRVIACSDSDEADDLILKFGLEGKLAIGSCLDGSFSVLVFE